MNTLGTLDHQHDMDVADAIFQAEANMCLSSAGLAIGTGSKAKVLIANTVAYTVGGIFKSKTTAEVAFTATTHDIAAVSTAARGAWYLLSLDADGTPAWTMGTVANTLLAKLPAPPAIGNTVIGAVKVEVAAGSTGFDASTDLLDAGHLTVRYLNVGFVHAMYGQEATITGWGLVASSSPSSSASSSASSSVSSSASSSASSSKSSSPSSSASSSVSPSSSSSSSPSPSSGG